MRPGFRRDRHGRQATRTIVTPRPVRKILGLIPAHNEAENLRAVIAEVRAEAPALDILVIDDGSNDETADLLPHLDVRWLEFPHRLGIGSAVRAGLRYAHRLGYDAAIRVDGDGQHCARDIELLLRPIFEDRADVVLGSRYAARNDKSSGRRILQRMLAVCLSLITRARVTDPTSGFCAVGPGALGLLAEHHPTGYPEAELRLFLSRNRLRVVEVPVVARPRFGGTTSLTVGRLAGAGARVLLAMIVVPLRSRVRNPL
jgi:glycosyltransferase involved in cell wall biosynthesis